MVVKFSVKTCMNDLEYTAQLGECLEMVDVYDQWPQSIVQICAQTFERLTETHTQIQCIHISTIYKRAIVPQLNTDKVLISLS